VLAVLLKPGAGVLQASVTGLRYNGVAASPPFSSLAYSWKTDNGGALKSLEQDLTVGKGPTQQNVDAVYNGSKDETKIGTSTVPGLVLVKVASSAGALVIES
jgi:hypothetical protein